MRPFSQSKRIASWQDNRETAVQETGDDCECNASLCEGSVTDGLRKPKRSIRQETQRADQDDAANEWPGERLGLTLYRKVTRIAVEQELDGNEDDARSEEQKRRLSIRPSLCQAACRVMQIGRASCRGSGR